MGQQAGEIKQALLAAGKREFLEYGYEKASLRRIAAAAAVTTGAIYAHFSGKEELFDEITKDVSEEIMQSFTAVHEEYEDLQLKDLKSLNEMMEEQIKVYIPEVINYLYDHYDMVKLILCCNHPDRLEAWLDRITDVEARSIDQLGLRLEEAGYAVRKMDEEMTHILSSSLIRQVKEFIMHDLSREQALEYTYILCTFWYAGWLKVLIVR